LKKDAVATVTRFRAITIIYQLAVSFALAFALVVTVRAICAYGQTTPDDWFKLATAIQQQEHRLDREDRFFVRYMVNVLSLDQATVPTGPQQQWLLNIKRELHIVFVPERR